MYRISLIQKNLWIFVITIISHADIADQVLYYSERHIMQ